MLKSLCEFLKRHVGRRTYTAERCGHRTALSGKVSGEAGGVPFRIRLILPRNRHGVPDWCLQCCASITIRCARCGKLIVVGDPVVLFAATGPEYAVNGIPEHAVIYQDNPPQLVVCMRDTCPDDWFKVMDVGLWVPIDDNGSSTGGFMRLNCPYQYQNGAS